jgi:hypothetical protein
MTQHRRPNTPPPLPSPPAADVTKDELHFRRIDMRGFRRSDGLYEIEGRVTDRKPYDFAPAGGGQLVPANRAIHDMGVRLVFDNDMVVHDVHTFMDAMPYLECRGGGEALQSLKGLRIAGGWSKEVRNRLSGARSCTHLMELLIPMATAAVQSLSVTRKGHPERLDATGRPVKIDSCYAYGAQRGQVLRRWPEFHRPESANNSE